MGQCESPTYNELADRLGVKLEPARKQVQRKRWNRITSKLRSYRATRRDVIPAVEYRSHKDLNNRVENSHLPLRKRE